VRFDIQVGDRVEGRTRAVLLQDDQLRQEWLLEGSVIQGPDAWRGRDLRELSRWRNELPAHVAMHAVLMRRAVHISAVRKTPPVGRATDRGPRRLGVCFTYQPERVRDAIVSSTSLIDFSRSGKAPLDAFPGGASDIGIEEQR
jgi:hypothetical protein